MEKTNFNFDSFNYTTEAIASYLDKKVASLDEGTIEALDWLSHYYEGRGAVQLKHSTMDDRVVYVYLSFIQKLDWFELEKQFEESDNVFRGKARAFADGVFTNEVVNIIKKSWKHNEMLANYGDIRHQLAQLSRGLSSKAKAQKQPEMRVGYRIVAENILKPAVVRQVLAKVKAVGKVINALNGKGIKVLNIISETDVNTFQTMKGGRIRIAIQL